MRIDYIDNMDCLDGLKDIPDQSVDLIFTDPPYFLTMGHAGSKDTAKSMGRRSNRQFGDLAIAKPFYQQLAREFNRVLKPDGAAYICTDWRGYAFYYPIFAAELPVRNLIVWDKLSGPDSWYSYSHELIIMASKAKKLRPTPEENGTAIWRIKAFCSGAASTDGAKVHPTQKPIALITKVIEDNSDPGDVVLDAFMGSGSTAVAAIRTGRHYVGFELDEKYHAIAMDRIAKELEAQGVEAEEDWMA